MTRKKDERHPEQRGVDGLAAAATAQSMESSQLNKFHTKGGAGFAAEDANARADRAAGKVVEETGRDNTLNGPDRIADGIGIQSKYHATASRSLNDAFDPTTGQYKYRDQQLEVPADQYDECVRQMRTRIAEGKVPGVTNPDEATSIVKQGSITYEQARNISRPGNIDSLRFDAQQQAATSTYAFGLSFLVTYARQKWDGQDDEAAIEASLAAGLAAGATSFLTGILSRQLLRTKLPSMTVPLFKHGVKFLHNSGSLGKGAIEGLAKLSTGKDLFGSAAQNHVAKLFRSNAITGAVTTAVVSAPDFYRAAVDGSVSWAQFSKNLTVNAAGVGGGMSGAWAGALAGTAVGGPVGAVVGGVIGGLAGGMAGSAASKAVLDTMIEDDAKEMFRLLREYLPEMASDYLLSAKEAEEFFSRGSTRIDEKFLREMYASDTRRDFVAGRLADICQTIAKARPHVNAPDAQQVQNFLTKIEKKLTTEIIDCEGTGCSQRLRIPLTTSLLAVTCPTCRHTFEYQGSPMEGAEDVTDIEVNDPSQYSRGGRAGLHSASA